MDVFNNSLNPTSDGDFSTDDDILILPDINVNKTYSKKSSLILQDKKAHEEENSYKWKFLDVDIRKYGTEADGMTGYNEGVIDIEEGFKLIDELKNPKIKQPTVFTEGQSTENFVHQINSFYEEMSLKIKYLKSEPALKYSEHSEIIRTLSPELTTVTKDEEQSDKMHELKRSISVIEEEIKKTEAELYTARSERLEVQNEMCTEIYKYYKFPDKTSQLFLDLCSFEASSNLQHLNKKEDEKKTKKKHTSHIDKQKADETEECSKNFMKRNIQFAKQGIMASYSLTDEEKQKLEDLVSDIDMNIDSADLKSSEGSYSSNKLGKSTISTVSESGESSECISNTYKALGASSIPAITEEMVEENCNAFFIPEETLNRIDTLDRKIETLKKNKDDNEQGISKDRNYDCGYEGRPWQDALLEEKLREVNQKLNAITQKNATEPKITPAKITLLPKEDSEEDSIINDTEEKEVSMQLLNSEICDNEILSDHEIKEELSLKDIPIEQKLKKKVKFKTTTKEILGSPPSTKPKLISKNIEKDKKVFSPRKTSSVNNKSATATSSASSSPN